MGSRSQSSSPEVNQLTKQEADLKAEFQRLERERDLPVRLEFELNHLRKTNGFLSIEQAKDRIVRSLAPIASGIGNKPIDVQVLPSGEAPLDTVTFLELYREMLTAIHERTSREELSSFLQSYVQGQIIPHLGPRKTVQDWFLQAMNDLKTEDERVAEIAEAKKARPSDAEIKEKKETLARVSKELVEAQKRAEGGLKFNPFAALKKDK